MIATRVALGVAVAAAALLAAPGGPAVAAVAAEPAPSREPVTPPDGTDVVITEEVHAAGLINYSCGPNYNPYDYYPAKADRTRLEYAAGTSRGGAGLYSGTWDSSIWWAWGSGLRAGDKVSLDWSDTGGASYHACHKTIASGASSGTTGGVNEVDGRYFRACVKGGSSWRCTRWWHVQGS
ncbi:hypothetical protein MF672_015770 [Actinomadura sp. ATCC 31491]|uniref:Secreted protein n=1 Tax=Actinomadura luzonensis TaxID=2805427 RepID=A0ABT0FSI3_9ACTN|nr:hypothetical protein [Actinomadura luzonensis]MCK2215234.1 hypothetical protein [Actinomadura luzonensis]